MSPEDRLTREVDETLARAAALHDEIHRRIEALEDLEQDAQIERARCRRLFDLRPEAMVVTTSAGVIRRFNPAAVRLLRVAPTALDGKPVYVFVALEDRYALREGMTSLKPGGRFSRTITLLPRQSPPLPVRVDVQASSASDRDGLAFGWLIEPVTDSV